MILDLPPNMANTGISNEDVYKLMEFLTINNTGALMAGFSPEYISEKIELYSIKIQKY